MSEVSALPFDHIALNPVSIPGLSIDARPPFVFGREQAWAALVRFVETPGTGARLGSVYGRRRQGKTLLLEALCESAGGFLWQARQQSTAQNLADLELALGRFTAPARDSDRGRLNALVGGIPAYREFVSGVGPRRADVDAWGVSSLYCWHDRRLKR
jgi:hypothetical protein